MENFNHLLYSRSEETVRFNTFAENVKKIEQHNKAGLSWKMGKLDYTYNS